jgi:hypothetical protein
MKTRKVEVELSRRQWQTRRVVVEVPESMPDRIVLDRSGEIYANFSGGYDWEDDDHRVAVEGDHQITEQIPGEDDEADFTLGFA